jgi:hypothetical protein
MENLVCDHVRFTEEVVRPVGAKGNACPWSVDDGVDDNVSIDVR